MLSNPYARWQALGAAKPRQVGTVVSIQAGVATVELPGGGLVKAVGTASINDRVFVRDGSIEGPAPNLNYITSTI